jgi:hypothetical protein
MILLLVSKLMMKSCTTKQRDYLQEIAPSKQSIVKFYQSNDTPILRNTT